MISRFLKVMDNLYRGSAPLPSDVKELQDKYGIKKIISLDEESGQKIERICKALGIEHLTFPINGKDIKPIAELFSHDLKTLLLDGGPTYVHCKVGKDRTGMLIAAFKCEQGTDFKDAMKEAKKIGFGLGLDPSLTKFYEKIVKNFDKKKDVNDADIVTNQRFDPLVLDDVNRKSFAPYEDIQRNYKYNPSYDQYPTRDNVDFKEYIEKKVNTTVPAVGLYDSNSGIKGVGPVDNGGGFTST